MGGDLRTERLLLAYRLGIFPWYEGDTILWWSPDPRFVLLPADLHVGKTSRSLLKRETFRFTTNQAFPEVIRNCRGISRKGQDGTWITPEVERAYVELHRLGHAHSAEVWAGDELVGGLYGIRMGQVFFGESMFSRTSQASRFAFIRYVRLLQSEGVKLIDCQVHTDYLESLGARMMDGFVFRQLLDKYIPEGQNLLPM